MGYSKCFFAACILLALCACQGAKEEPQSQPEVRPVPVPQQEEPKVKPVMASSEPQHGGLVKRMGDYMVELKPDVEGNMDVYVQKVEGAVSAIENVQVEMKITPRTEEKADPDPAADTGEASAEQEEAAEAAGEPEQDESLSEKHVIFYPEEGKLTGRIAGMEEGKYDVDIALYDDEKNMSEAKFKDVDLKPEDIELEAEHEGEVYVIDENRMEVVQTGDNVEIYLANLKDGKAIQAQEASIRDIVIETEDDKTAVVKVNPVGTKFVGKLPVPVDMGIKLIDFTALIRGKEFKRLRVPEVPKRKVGAGATAAAAEETPEKAVTPKLRPKIMKPVGIGIIKTSDDKSDRDTRSAEKSGGDNKKKKKKEKSPSRQSRTAKKAE